MTRRLLIAVAAACLADTAVAAPDAASSVELLGAASLGAVIALCAVALAAGLRARREVAALRRSLDCAADGWWQADAQARVLSVEAGRRRGAAFVARQLIGRPVWQLAEAAPAPPAIADAIAAGAPFFDVRVEAGAADAPLAALTISGAPLFSPRGRLVGYAGTLRLATAGADLPATQADELRRQLARVEADYAARSQQFELAVKELESFAHSVSHDLRAPLRVVDGFATIVLEDYGARLDDLGREHLKRILAAGSRMNAMIDTLLSLSRTTGRELERERVDLSRAARELADELAASDRSRDVHFDIAADLRVDGDPTLLRLVLQNLLGNAFKFTARVAHARIEFGCAESGGQLAYFVRDNGAGFDMRFAEKLFGLFQRFHPQNQFPGTGVGLATVQRIVRKHGGRIWAESEPDRGATFFFTLWENPT